MLPSAANIFESDLRFSKRRSDLALLMNTTRRRINIGNFGIRSVFYKASILSSVELRIWSPTYKSPVLDTVMNELSHTVSPSDLAQYQPSSVFGRPGVCTGGDPGPEDTVGPDGKLDFRISRQLRSYTRGDAPPNRVKPAVPITRVIHALCFIAFDKTTEMILDKKPTCFTM